MAYDVTELPDGRAGSRDEKGIRHYTRVFRVISPFINDGPSVIATKVTIAMYASYITDTETDLYAILKNKSAKPVSGEPFHWDVTCEYNSGPLDFGAQAGASPGQATQPGQQSNDKTPTSRPWTIKLGSNKKTRPLKTDQNNVVVANSAYQPFDPPVEIEVAYPTVSITAFTTTFNFNQQTYYMNSINASAWSGYAAKRMRVIDYGATSQYENGAFFWQVDIVLEYNPEADWNPLKIQDLGCSEKGGGGAGAALNKPIITPSGSEVQPPGVPLDGSGHALKIGGSIVYLDFKAYRETNFALLII